MAGDAVVVDRFQAFNDRRCISGASLGDRVGENLDLVVTEGRDDRARLLAIGGLVGSEESGDGGVRGRGIRSALKTMPSTAFAPASASDGSRLPSVDRTGVVTPASRSCFMKTCVSGGNIGVKMKSGCGSMLEILVTTAEKSPAPIEKLSSAVIFPPPASNTSVKYLGRFAVYGYSGEPSVSPVL